VVATATLSKERKVMNTPIETRPGWRKSSYSGGGNDCVEVSDTALADTKDPTHAEIRVSRRAFEAFTNIVANMPRPAA